jgi:hypothetical protein
MKTRNNFPVPSIFMARHFVHLTGAFADSANRSHS